MLRVFSSNGPQADRDFTKSQGENVAVVVYHDFVHIVLLRYSDNLGQPCWFISAHWSVIASRDEETPEASFYHEGIGYVTPDYNSLAIFDVDDPIELIEDSYQDIQSQGSKLCTCDPNDRMCCPKIFCPYQDITGNNPSMFINGEGKIVGCDSLMAQFIGMSRRDIMQMMIMNIDAHIPDLVTFKEKWGWHRETDQVQTQWKIQDTLVDVELSWLFFTGEEGDFAIVEVTSPKLTCSLC